MLPTYNDQGKHSLFRGNTWEDQGTRGPKQGSKCQDKHQTLQLHIFYLGFMWYRLGSIRALLSWLLHSQSPKELHAGNPTLLCIAWASAASLNLAQNLLYPLLPVHAWKTSSMWMMPTSVEPVPLDQSCSGLWVSGWTWATISLEGPTWTGCPRGSLVQLFPLKKFFKRVLHCYTM